MDQFLNRDEQKFYLQGDMTAYRGMNGAELKEELDGIETISQDYMLEAVRKLTI